MDFEPMDFMIVSEPAVLRALSHRERMSILRVLSSSAKTGSQAAAELGLPANRVHYHIATLVAAGLVREVGKGRRRWKEERVYRASARHFMVDPSVGGADAETARHLLQAVEHSFLAWRRREVLRFDLGAFADKIVRDCLRVRTGEQVLAVFGGPSLELGEAIISSVEAAGGRAAVRLWSRSVALGILDRREEADLRDFAFVDPSIDASLSAVVLLSTAVPQGAPPSPEQIQKLPLLMEAVSRWHHSLRERGIRYLEVALPHRSLVGGIEASPEAALDAYWRCLDADYAALRTRGEDLLARARGQARLHLTSPGGTDLDVPVEAERPVLNDGAPEPHGPMKGLPAGTVSFLPAEHGARGVLHAEYTLVGGRHVRGIRAVLEDGRIVELHAEEAGDLLRARMEAAAGDPGALSEIVVGLNPGGGREDGPAGALPALTGLPVLDTCLEGRVTASFGNNELLGGRIRSTLDLAFPLREGTLHAGPVLLVLSGRVQRSDSRVP